jgi:hypothetical protein
MAPKTSAWAIPPKKALLKKGKATASAEKNIDDPPAGSSDEEDRANINPSSFRKGSEQPKNSTKGSRVLAGGNKITFNGKDTRNTRNEKAGASPGSSSTKRKDPPDPFLGKGMVDPYGRITQKKKAMTMYGSSSQPHLPSSKSAPAPKKSARPPPGSFMSERNKEMLI